MQVGRAMIAFTDSRKWMSGDTTYINMRNVFIHDMKTTLQDTASIMHESCVLLTSCTIIGSIGPFVNILGLLFTGDLGSKISEANGVYFDERTVINWFIQITFALKYIHKENILHRGNHVTVATFKHL